MYLLRLAVSCKTTTAYIPFFYPDLVDTAPFYYLTIRTLLVGTMRGFSKPLAGNGGHHVES